MRILMLGNSLTSANHMPQTLAQRSGAEVICHTRGGARLAEHLNNKTQLGMRTQAALTEKQWSYVILQEMSNGPITSTKRFLSSVQQLCGQIRQNGATPILYATWAYQREGQKMAAMKMDYDTMFHQMQAAYHQAAEENHALLANVGQRFYELCTIQELYAADGVHPNKLGSQIAAETIAQVIAKHEKEVVEAGGKIIL